jgi:hypothetical protein
VGRDSTAADLADDWVLVHEIAHTAFPQVHRRHRWLEEGLAVYVESIARLRAGELEADFVWGQFARRMHHGLPEPGDAGLDDDHRWGRIYWGGALFAMLADLRIRRQTQNRLGLEDALRAILEAGRARPGEWRVEQALAVGDRATGTSVLGELYRQMGTNPGGIDLEALWQRLGVETTQGRVRLCADAELAPQRRRISAAGTGS